MFISVPGDVYANGCDGSNDNVTDADVDGHANMQMTGKLLM